MFPVEKNRIVWIIGKKTTYALKTPHVVALPFIYDVGFINL